MVQSGGMVDCVKGIAKHEGILGFYKGLKVNVIKVGKMERYCQTRRADESCWLI